MTTERNGRVLLAKQGEFRGEKELLLRGVPEASERKERGTNEWSEDAESTGTLIGRFYVRRQRANVTLQYNERDSFAVWCKRLFDRAVEEHRKMRIMSKGAIENVREKCLGMGIFNPNYKACKGSSIIEGWVQPSFGLNSKTDRYSKNCTDKKKHSL